MKLAYFPDQIALGSNSVLDAFLDSAKNQGFDPVVNSMTADAAVIWSVLWRGRLRKNQEVYAHYRKLKKPVFILEVGSLIRGKTWKVCANNTTAQGIYGNLQRLDPLRPDKLGLKLKNPQRMRSEILISLQHQESLQWQGQLPIDSWLKNTVTEIKKYSDRPIIVRPHPRAPFYTGLKTVSIERPKKLPETYDIFDISYDYHCVINHNSGTAIQAAINGTPTICDSSSLAYPVSIDFSEIEHAQVPDRTQWFLEICHTEWTVEEIGQGIPLTRLIPLINH